MMERFMFFKKVWSIAQTYKWQFIFSYLVLLAELTFTQSLPFFLGEIVDAAVYQSDMILFIRLAAIYAFLFIGQQSCSFAQLQLWQKLNNKYVYGLRLRCYKKILRLKAILLTDIKTGDMLQMINGDTMEFHHVIQRYGMRIVNAGIGTIVSLTIVAYMKWEIALIIIVLIPASILMTKKVKYKMEDVAKEIRNKQGEYNSWVMEILNGIREIKLFAAEANVIKHFTSKNEDIIKSNVKQVKTQFKSDQLINLVYFISQIIFYILCAFFTAGGLINIAEYISISAYYTLISNNFQRILRDNMAFQARRVAIERVFALLESDYENEENLAQLIISDGKVTINNLSFSYADNHDVLKNITYTILPGKRIGIVGESGVGKSTFAQIMLKFFAPKNGTVLFDKYDISDCTYSSVRDNVGIVSQETIIFNTTVKDNICFGADVPDEVIWNVLEKAYLKHEIEKFPNGLNTVLGKDAINLSGGQNQRLAIARIIFKNPKIVILDEATSALDENSERIVQQALDKLTIGRTSIVISHRLNSIINSDDIIVLKEGKVVANGKYKDLIQNDNTFKALFAAQVEKLEVMQSEI